MRLTASAPVTWPAPDLVERWWLEQLAPLHATHVDGRGRVVDPDDPEGASEPDGIRLVTGTHLAPGASYVVESPALDGVEITGEVTGEPRRRLFRARMQGRRPLLGLGPAPVVELVLDGLDHLVGVDATSTNPYLSGSLRVRPEPTELVRMRLELRWLVVDLEARVEGGELGAELHLAARGVWSPAVSPVVAVLGRMARESLDVGVTDWAAMLTGIAEGRGSTHPSGRELARSDRERRRREKEALWVRGEAARRFRQVQDRIDQEGWWGQRGSAWRRAYAELGPATWPDRGGGEAPGWERAVAESVRRLSRTKRSSRREQIEPELDRLTFAELAGRREPRPEPEAPLLRAEDLELRWLRSPLSVWAHLRRTGGLTAADEQAMPSVPEDPDAEDEPG